MDLTFYGIDQDHILERLTINSDTLYAVMQRHLPKSDMLKVMPTPDSIKQYFADWSARDFERAIITRILYETEITAQKRYSFELKDIQHINSSADANNILCEDIKNAVQ